MNTSPLFKTGKSWEYNAFVRNHDELLQNKWDTYAHGYKLSAEALIEKIMNDPLSIDFYALPIVFLYRHFTELRLKEIIERGSLLLDEESQFPKTHDIKILWDKAKSIIKKIWPQTTSDELAYTELMIVEINNLDKKSDAFRYPVDKDLSPTLFGLEFFNLKEFSDAITPLVETLDGTSTAITVYLGDKEEIMKAYDFYPERYI